MTVRGKTKKKKKTAFPSVLITKQYDTVVSLPSTLLPLSLSAHAHLFLPLLLFLLLLFGDCLAALGCSPVSLKPISSITEIISLRGRVFVQEGWISQLSEAEENREEWLRVTSVCVCVLCSLVAHGCFLINASLSWRRDRRGREAGRDDGGVCIDLVVPFEGSAVSEF